MQPDVELNWRKLGEVIAMQVPNAINADMHWELEEAFNAFAAAPDEQLRVITGEGRAFCAGTDLKAVVAEGRRDYPPHGYAPADLGSAH